LFSIVDKQLGQTESRRLDFMSCVLFAQWQNKSSYIYNLKGPLIYFLFLSVRFWKRLNSLMDSTIHTPYFIPSNTTAVVMSSQKYFVTTYHIVLCMIINSKILKLLCWYVYIHVVKYNARLNKYIKIISGCLLL